MVRSLTWLLLAVLWALGCASGSRTGSVAFAVLDDSTDAPLSNAVVHIIPVDQQVVVPTEQEWKGAHSLPTGEDARVFVKELPPGIYFARPEYPGYKRTKGQRIEVTLRDTTNVTFKMHRDEMGVFNGFR